MKESYIKLPNITVGKLQDVVDFLDDNNIEYIEDYKRDEEIERLNNIIKKAIEFIYENAYDEERENCIDDLWGEIPKLLEILKGSDKE